MTNDPKEFLSDKEVSLPIPNMTGSAHYISKANWESWKKGMSEKSWRGNQIKKRAGVRASQAILFIFHVFLSPLSCMHSFSFFFFFFSKKAKTLLIGKKKKNMFHLSNIFGCTPNQSKTLYLRQQMFILFFVVLWINHVSSGLGQVIWDGRILDLFMNISGGWQCLVEGNCT